MLHTLHLHKFSGFARNMRRLLTRRSPHLSIHSTSWNSKSSLRKLRRRTLLSWKRKWLKLGTGLYIHKHAHAHTRMHAHTHTHTCVHTHRLEFLAEYTSIALSDLRLNSETFRWIERIPSILDEHREISTRSRREAEDALKVCILTKEVFFTLNCFPVCLGLAIITCDMLSCFLRATCNKNPWFS